MDMYQKREMRKNKKMNENTKSLPSTSINCLSCIYGDYHLSPYKMGIFKK